MQHTPGKWAAIPEYAGPRDNRRRAGFTVYADATCEQRIASIDWITPTAGADAVLIAAAPAMLQTLRDIVDMLHSSNDTRADILAIAQKTIAKATD